MFLVKQIGRFQKIEVSPFCPKTDRQLKPFSSKKIKFRILKLFHEISKGNLEYSGLSGTHKCNCRIAQMHGILLCIPCLRHCRCFCYCCYYFLFSILLMIHTATHIIRNNIGKGIPYVLKSTVAPLYNSYSIFENDFHYLHHKSMFIRSSDIAIYAAWYSYLVRS